jgi:hypothetical protein
MDMGGVRNGGKVSHHLCLYFSCPWPVARTYLVGGVQAPLASWALANATATVVAHRERPRLSPMPQPRSWLMPAWSTCYA